MYWCTHTHSVAPHSQLAAESEDTTDVNRLPAEVPAVQTHSHRPVAQFTQRQGHSAEVQQTTAEITHTHFITHDINILCYWIKGIRSRDWSMTKCTLCPLWKAPLKLSVVMVTWGSPKKQTLALIDSFLETWSNSVYNRDSSWSNNSVQQNPKNHVMLL